MKLSEACNSQQQTKGLSSWTWHKLWSCKVISNKGGQKDLITQNSGPCSGEGAPEKKNVVHTVKLSVLNGLESDCFWKQKSHQLQQACKLYRL